MEKDILKKESKKKDGKSCENIINYLKTNKGQIIIKPLSMLNQNHSDKFKHTIFFETRLLEKMIIEDKVRAFDKKNQKYVNHI